MQKHFFIFFHFFNLDKSQKSAISLGFLFIFQGIFFIFFNLDIYLAHNQHQS